MAAVAWTAAASLAGALWRGFRHRDRSAFHGYEFPEDDGDLDEWASRTGLYSYLRDREERLLHDDDHLRNHESPEPAHRPSMPASSNPPETIAGAGGSTVPGLLSVSLRAGVQRTAGEHPAGE